MKKVVQVSYVKMSERCKLARHMLSILQYIIKQKQNKMVKTQLVKTCEFLFFDKRNKKP